MNGVANGGFSPVGGFADFIARTPVYQSRSAHADGAVFRPRREFSNTDCVFIGLETATTAFGGALVSYAEHPTGFS
jgi:hypothetical protein